MAIQKRDCFTEPVLSEILRLRLRMTSEGFAMTAILSIIILVLSSSLFAEEIPISWKAEKSESYVENNKIVKVILKGNVEIKKRFLIIKADEIIYNRETGDIWARGKVVFLQKGKRIEGKELLYNLSGESGFLKDVKFFSPPWYGKAKEAQIEKKGEYLLKDGYITTCNHDPPHYRLKAKRIKVSVDNKIEAKKITFCIRRSPIDKPPREIPILYLPYYSQNLDIKKEAESFLTFVPGYSSEWGVYLLTAVNTFLNPYFNASYYLDFREKKGVGIGFDLKKKPKGEKEEGNLKTYYLKERDTNENRYQVSYKYRNVWEKDERDLTLLSEMHKLSDNEFLKDYFYEDYLEEKQPRSYLFFSERKAERFLGFLARGRINDFYPVTERLPEMNLSFPLQKLGKNLYFRSETNMVNLRKEIEGETKSSLRLDAFNEISSSKRYGGWLNVRPHVGSRFTFYSEDKEGKAAFRSLGEAGLDLGTKFQKPFTMRSSSFTHIVEPGLSFDYREVFHSPEELLNFDSLDDIQSDKYITGQLINRICLRQEQKKLELLRLNLKSHYSLRKSRFEDASLILDLTPRGNWSFHNESDYDIPEGCWKTSTSGFSWWKERYTFNLSHYYQNKGVNDLVPSIYWKINPKWQMRLATSYRLKEKDFRNSELTVYRDLHCWQSSISFSRSSEETSVFLTFYLTAFPNSKIRMKSKFGRQG